MMKVIKLTLVTFVAIFLSACWHEVEVVKAEEVVLYPEPIVATTPVLTEDIMPSYSK